MSQHYYKCEPDKDPVFLKSVTSPAKARGKEYVYPSVTTILSICPDAFLGTWSKKEMFNYGRQTELSYEEAEERLYGMRRCPEQKIAIPSAEFGTNAHKYLEDWGNGEEDENNPYADICSGVIELFDEWELEPELSESIQYSHDDACAGTVDLIAEIGGDTVLVDYKFRSCKGSGKFWFKDCMQLAIESEWVQERYNLEFRPDIISICICTNTGKVYPKRWKALDQVQGINAFRAIRDVARTMKGWEV
jgi:hypothetical protein